MARASNRLRNILLTAGTILVFGVIIWKSFLQPPFYKNISVREVHSLLESGDNDYVLVDVRTSHEYTGELGHLPGALLFPIRNLDIQHEELRKHQQSGESIILYCRSGNRSRRAAQFLTQHGFKNIYNMEGGMKAWNQTYSRPEESDNPPPNTNSKAADTLRKEKADR